MRGTSPPRQPTGAPEQLPRQLAPRRPVQAGDRSRQNSQAPPGLHNAGGSSNLQGTRGPQSKDSGRARVLPKQRGLENSTASRIKVNFRGQPLQPRQPRPAQPPLPPRQPRTAQKPTRLTPSRCRCSPLSCCNWYTKHTNHALFAAKCLTQTLNLRHQTLDV